MIRFLTRLQNVSVFVALLCLCLQTAFLRSRVAKLEDAQNAGQVPFPEKLVFNKSDLYAPCIGVGDGKRRNILWHERTKRLCDALNSPEVRKALVEAYGPSDFKTVTDLKFRPEQHHPHTLEVIEGNQIWWREEVGPLIPVLNTPQVQAALQKALKGQSVALPEMPIEST